MKINLTNRLGKADMEFFRSVLTESFNLYNVCESIIAGVSDYATGKVPYNTDEGYEVIDRLTEIMQVRVESLKMFSESRVSGYSAANRRTDSALDAYYSIMNVAADSVDSFIPLTLSELESTYADLKSVVAHISIFIRTQYEFASYVAGDEPEFALEVYMKDKGLTREDVLELDKDLIIRSIIYRPRVAVFDDYPDLQGPFLDKVGDEFYDFEYINVNYVLAVINDELSLEALLEKIDECR